MYSLKHSIVWLLLMAKRFCKKPMFILTLLCILVCVFVLKANTGTDEAIVKVALYVEEKGNNELADTMINRLLEQSDDVARFYEVNTYDELRDEVIRDNATCGFVIPAEFSLAVKNLAINNRKELPYDDALIKCVRKESSNFVQIAMEMVFTSYYDVYSNEILLNYMLNNEEAGTDKMTAEDLKMLEEFKQSYEIPSEFFEFNYVDGTKNEIISDNKVSFLLLPIRGLILAIVLLATMTGGIMLYRDKEKGMFDSIVLTRRGVINYIYFLIPSFMAGVVGVAGIMFSGIHESIIREIVAMLIYVFFVSGMCNLIRILCGNINYYASVIPIFLLMNIIFCPVFVNVNGIIAIGTYIQKMLPVYYGLNNMYDNNVKLGMVIAGIVMLGLATKDKK